MKLGVFFCLSLCVNHLISSTLGQDDEEIKTRIRDWVANSMSCRRNPGLSLAVVRGGEVFMTEGFGQRDLSLDLSDPNANVTDTTRFCLASCGKAMTSTLMAKLIGDNAVNNSFPFPVNWNTRVSDIMGPDWFLGDVYRTTETNIRDLLSHKSGFPYYGGAWEIGLDTTPSKQDYCSRMSLMEQVYEFREWFTYSDLMYTLSACVAERIGGDDFLQLYQDRLFGPLGMTGTVFPQDDNNWDDNFALQYVWHEDENAIKPVSMRLLENSHPGEAGGGHWSNARDMATWMQFILNRGRHGDDQLIPEYLIDNTQQSQSAPWDYERKRPHWPYSESSAAYGKGWYIGDYQGYRRFQHAGNWYGYNAYVTLIPALGIGIYSSVNGPMYNDGYYTNPVLHYYVGDLLLGLQPWLNESTACSFPSPWPRQKEAEYDPHGNGYQRSGFEVPEPVADMKASIDPPEQVPYWYTPYEGQYGHMLFGNYTVYHNETDDKLHFRSGRFGSGSLDQQGDFFYLNYYGHLWYVYKTGPGRGNPSYIQFQQLQGGFYQELVNVAYQGSRPPVYTRGVQWDDWDLVRPMNP